MGVSENNGIPKSSILLVTRFSIINHPFEVQINHSWEKDLKLNFVKGEVSETALKEALATEAGFKNP